MRDRSIPPAFSFSWLWDDCSLESSGVGLTVSESDQHLQPAPAGRVVQSGRMAWTSRDPLPVGMPAAFHNPPPRSHEDEASPSAKDDQEECLSTIDYAESARSVWGQEVTTYVQEESRVRAFVELDSVLRAHSYQVCVDDLIAPPPDSTLIKDSLSRVFKGRACAATGPDSVEREVALKFAKQQGGQSEGEVLEQMSSLLFSIRVGLSVVDDNIVTTYGIGIKPMRGVMCFAAVLELMDRNLYSLLLENSVERGERSDVGLIMSADDYISVALHVAKGLCALEKARIVHGDLKADNVMVSGSREKGYIAKIGDFGSAQALPPGNDICYATRARFTPARSSLEVNVWQRFSVSSDVHSFGLLLWEIWSDGASPFYTWDDQDVIDSLAYGNAGDDVGPPLYLSPKKTCSDPVAHGVRSIIRSCCQKFRAQRPSPQDLLSSLAQLKLHVRSPSISSVQGRECGPREPHPRALQKFLAHVVDRSDDERMALISTTEKDSMRMQDLLKVCGYKAVHSGSLKQNMSIAPAYDSEMLVVVETKREFENITLETIFLQLRGIGSEVTTDGVLSVVTPPSGTSFVIRRQGVSLEVCLNDTWGGGRTFDLVPALKCDDGEGYVVKRKLTEGGEDFEFQTEPESMRKLVHVLDKVLGGKFTAVVRLLKYWNLNQQKSVGESKPFSDIFLECCAFDCMKSEWIESLVLKQESMSFAAKLKPDVPLEMLLERAFESIVHRCNTGCVRVPGSGSRMELTHSRSPAALQVQAERARGHVLVASSADSDAEQLYHWREVFGDAFGGHEEVLGQPENDDPFTDETSVELALEELRKARERVDARGKLRVLRRFLGYALLREAIPGCVSALGRILKEELENDDKVKVELKRKLAEFSEQQRVDLLCWEIMENRDCLFRCLLGDHRKHFEKIGIDAPPSAAFAEALRKADGIRRKLSTPLAYALEVGREQHAMALLKAGADPMLREHKFERTFQLAVEVASPELRCRLLNETSQLQREEQWPRDRTVLIRLDAYSEATQSNARILECAGIGEAERKGVTVISMIQNVDKVNHGSTVRKWQCWAQLVKKCFDSWKSQFPADRPMLLSGRAPMSLFIFFGALAQNIESVSIAHWNHREREWRKWRSIDNRMKIGPSPMFGRTAELKLTESSEVCLLFFTQDPSYGVERSMLEEEEVQALNIGAVVTVGPLSGTLETVHPEALKQVTNEFRRIIGEVRKEYTRLVIATSLPTPLCYWLGTTLQFNHNVLAILESVRVHGTMKYQVAIDFRSLPA